MSDPVAESLSQAIAMEQSGDPESALQVFDEAISRGLEEVLIFSNRGLLLDRMGRCEDALSSFRKANVLSPNFRDHYNAGNMLMKLERYEDALSEFDASLSYRQDYPDCWTNKGIAHQLLSDPHAAKTAFDQALQLNPDFSPAHRCLALYFSQLDKTELAIGHFRKAAESNPNASSSWFEYGCSLYKTLDGTQVSFDPNGPEGKAISAFDKTIELDPTNAGAWGRKIGVQFRLADRAKAADQQTAASGENAPKLLSFILADLAETIHAAQKQFPDDQWFVARQKDVEALQAEE